MAGKVFFSVSMSLDGFIAPESLGDLMGRQWMELQQWIFPQRFFRENLKLGGGALSSRQLPLPDGVGQVRHPRGRLGADRLQGHAARVHALEQADSGAEQHG